MNDLPEPVVRLIAAANANDAEFIGVHVSLDVTEVEVRGHAVTVTAQVGGGGFNGPSHFTFDVAGERVSRMTIRA